MGRKHDFSIPIRATPEELWKALTEEAEIKKWFAPDVRVTPGEGGSIWMAWGEAASGESRIEAWEPGRRLRTAFGSGAVEYTIERQGTETVLRLMHSGFGDEFRSRVARHSPR